MKDYQFFEFDDFLEDVAFRRWVFHPLPQDEGFWQSWLAGHPDKQAVVQQARQQLLAIKSEFQHLTDDHIDQKVAQLVQQAQAQDSNRVRPMPISQWRHSGWYYLAASVALLVGLFWLYQTRLNDLPTATASTYTQLVRSATQPLQETSNTTPRPRRLTLPDGSQVVLYQNTRISYPRQFTAAKREVYLTGEAFFDVQKDPRRPFLVYANEMVTKVLGTSFFVKAYEQDKNVLVTVRTGKVSVFAQSDGQAATQKASRELGGMILTPNQQATLIRDDSRLLRSLVAQPVRVDNQPVTTAFTFRQTPIADVFAALERAYGVDIVFDEALMATCTLTARLDDESLYKKLDWICAGTESSYEVVDGQIIITSQGCN